MKKMFMAAAVLLCSPGMLFANPPTNLDCGYMNDNVSGQGTIGYYFKHDIRNSENKDPKVHFVKTLTISINGQVVSTIDNPKVRHPKQTFVNFSRLAPGTKVVFTAICSLGQSATQEIIIRQPQR